MKYLAHVNDLQNDIDSFAGKTSVRETLNLSISFPCQFHKTNPLKFIRILYLGSFSSSLSKILKSFNFRPRYYNYDTIKKPICNSQDFIPSHSEGGVPLIVLWYSLHW